MRAHLCDNESNIDNPYRSCFFLGGSSMVRFCLRAGLYVPSVREGEFAYAVPLCARNYKRLPHLTVSDSQSHVPRLTSRGAVLARS